MYSPPGNTHGNPPAAAAADDEEDATANDKEKPAAVDKAAVAATATATVNDEAELQLGVLPRRPHPLLNPVFPPFVKSACIRIPAHKKQSFRNSTTTRLSCFTINKNYCI
jgi:hypothetical protein